MGLEKKPKIGISCSIFRREIKLLQEQKQLEIPFRYLGSMLHLDPEELDERLQAVTSEDHHDGKDIILVYGDCCPYMYTIKKQDHVKKIPGKNCIEILLGNDLYTNLIREGAFFLMPEWAKRWREIFQDEFKLYGEDARSFMTELHTKLIYVDTGLTPIPENLLIEISEYSGLPTEIMPVSLEKLLTSIQNANEQMENG